MISNKEKNSDIIGRDNLKEKTGWKKLEPKGKNK